MIFCPYCERDMHDEFNQIREELADKPHGVPVTLCPGCGEPLIADVYNFRKPTADEHVHLQENTGLRAAREAYVHMRDRGPVVTDMWNKYHENRLKPSLKRSMIKKDEHLYFLTQDVFFSAVCMAFTYFRHLMATANTPQEFNGRLALIEAELNAYAEYSKVPQEGTTRQ